MTYKNERLKTDIFPKGRISHFFMPALALELVLEKGNTVEIPHKHIEEVVKDIGNNMKSGNARWSGEYPFDYDDTIAARKVLALTGHPIKKRLKISFDKTGGVPTYFGDVGRQNNVDLVINARILDYLQKFDQRNPAREILLKYLISQKDRFGENVEEISRYYRSEGFLIYSLKDIARFLNLDLARVVKLKLHRLSNQTDAAFVLLALPELDSDVLTRYKYGIRDPLKLFRKQSTGESFSCDFLDQVVRDSAELKVMK